MRMLLGYAVLISLLWLTLAGDLQAQDESGGKPWLQKIIIYDEDGNVRHTINFPTGATAAAHPEINVPGRSFYVEVWGVNTGDTVRRGGFLTLSVEPLVEGLTEPTLEIVHASVPPDIELEPDQKCQRRCVYTTADLNSISIKPTPGQTEAPRMMTPRFPSAEIWAKPWLDNNNNSHWMKVLITLPGEKPNARLQLKSRMSLFTYDNFITRMPGRNYESIDDPESSLTFDQQGYAAWTTQVIVRYVDATPTPTLVPVPVPTLAGTDVTEFPLVEPVEQPQATETPTFETGVTEKLLFWIRQHAYIIILMLVTFIFGFKCLNYYSPRHSLKTLIMASLGFGICLALFSLSIISVAEFKNFLRAHFGDQFVDGLPLEIVVGSFVITAALVGSVVLVRSRARDT